MCYKVKTVRWLAGLTAGFIITACAGGASAKAADPPPQAAQQDEHPPEPGGTGVIGFDWVLVEIVTPESGIIDLNRPQLEADGMGDVYSLRFDGEERVSGKAAPNRYTADCGWGDDSTVGIGPIAATRMMAFKEPEPLKEPEFFDYLSRVTRWAVMDQGQRMELYTEPPRATLVFARK